MHSESNLVLESINDRYAIYNFGKYTRVFDFKYGTNWTEHSLFYYINGEYKYYIDHEFIYRIRLGEIINKVDHRMTVYNCIFYKNQVVLIGHNRQLYIIILILDANFTKKVFSVDEQHGVTTSKLMGNKIIFLVLSKLISFDLDTYIMKSESNGYNQLGFPVKSINNISKYIYISSNGDVHYYPRIKVKKWSIEISSIDKVLYNEKIMLIDDGCYNHNMQLLYKVKIPFRSNNITFRSDNIAINNRFILTDMIQKFPYSIKYCISKSIRNNNYFHISRLLF